MNSLSLVEMYMNRFVNRTDLWTKQVITPNEKCLYYWQKPDQEKYRYQPFDAALVRKMFAGDITASIASSDANGLGKWLAFDDDHDDGALDKLEQTLNDKDWGWHTIREGKRPGRGGHLWLLFDAPLPASDLIDLADAMLLFARVRGVERFPKFSDKLSALRAPLSVHRKPGADNTRGWFEGPPKDLKSQLLWLSEQPLNSAKNAMQVAEQHRPRPKIRKQVERKTFQANVVPILQMVEYRRVGKQYVTQCPLCAQEGHDKRGDNLQISLDGKAFSCVFGGVGAVHKGRDIIRALRG